MIIICLWLCLCWLMRSIYNDNDITIGGGMLFQTSDETSTLTRPWDRFLKIVIFLSLEDTRPFTFNLPGLHKKERRNRQKTETSTNSKKGAHPKSWKVLKYMEKDRDKDKHRSPPLNIVQLKVWQRGLYGGWGGLEGKWFWQLEASSPWKII